MKIITFLKDIFHYWGSENPYYDIPEFAKFGKRIKFIHAFRLALMRARTKSWKRIFKEIKKQWTKISA